jgi:hypothetical protein
MDESPLEQHHKIEKSKKKKKKKKKTFGFRGYLTWDVVN